MTTQVFTAIRLALFFVILIIVAASVRAQKAAPPQCVQPPNTTMVAWYPFDELAGSTSANLATGNTGTQVNGPLGILGGKVAGAVSFNGINQFVESPSSIDTNIGIVGTPFSCNGNDSTCWGNFSIDTWINIPTTAPTGYMIITDKRGGSPPAMQGYHFFVAGGSIGIQLADGLAPYPGYTNYYSPPLAPSLYDGLWHHVAVTVRRSGTNPTITWYHNGIPLVPTSNPSDRLGSLLNNSPLRIGTRTADPPLTGWFQGNLDELEIYNRELTGAEVYAIYNATFLGKCKPPDYNPNGALASCVPSSSVGMLIQKPNVVAYVPLGNWSEGATGIQMVPIEPADLPTVITTNNVTNSCASNSVTGQTVCVANNTDVYLITGSTLNTTLTSGATAPANFSGGSCYNCGVAIDAVHNQAVIEVGLSGSPSGSGLQILDLTGTCTSTPFCAPFPLNYLVSEDIQIDPYRNLYLSPSEKGTHVYDVITHSPPGTGDVLTEYSETIALTHGGLDSAAEDCTTGIALSTVEQTHSLFITDLTQATYGSGTWSAPYAITNFPEFGNMFEGTDGISVAPGTQLAIVTSEGFGNGIGAVVLPATSGGGTPSFGDYVAAYLPKTPDGRAFSIGNDPHTVTAYVSPNDGRAYGVVGGWSLSVTNPKPTYLAVIDLQKLLNAPRCSGNCILGPHEVDLTYNLLTNGVVRYVSVF
jgi:hypothetical protein